jgi:CDP-6-deoxy-D-xylo-4-hexulose-3-dehydrase
MAIQLIKSAFYHEMETRAKLCDFLSRPEQLSIGKYCREFEEKFAKWQERKYCVFVNSGSSANLILLQSLLNTGRLQKGDEVGFSSLTWATNPMPLMQLGYTPVPIDIELNTLNVSLDSFKRSIEGKNIKALFITNVLGFCDNIDAIAEYCESQNILLIEDNCESMGTVYKGKKLGNYGLASTFSTYIGHHMSTIE